MTRWFQTSVLVFLLPACVSIGAVEGVVPPTADKDPVLSRQQIVVAGTPRWIHWQVEGDSERPLLMVLHGSLGDHRALLPLRSLADRYQVVFWDQRGNGLSERISSTEYTERSIVEEIDAVADLVSSGAPLTLVGHSFGAMYASLYLSRRPERVQQAVLVEPGGLNGRIFHETLDQIINIQLFDPALNEMFWQSEQVGPIDHDAADYRALMILLNGAQTNYHCDPDQPPAWPVWRPGAAAEVYRSRLLGSDALGRGFDFDFASGAARFPRQVLIVAGSCSALGPEYQRRWHAPLFADARVVEISDVGHRLVQEDPERLLDVLRSYLAEYVQERE